MNVNIIYLPYRRFHYADVLIKILDNIKHKGMIHISVCGMNHHRGECATIADKFRNIGINATPFNVTTGWTNYMDKIRGVLDLKYEYTIKLDEDIILNVDTWNFFLENLSILNDPKYGLFAPILSNGIPTVDNFVFKHFDDKSRSEIYEIFSNTKVPNLWGANYSSLDKLIRNSGYESDSYYNAVAQISHHYKGIHPIRISGKAQMYMNDWITKNFHKFFEGRTYTYEGSDRPYFCNSVFAIKTSVYNDIVYDESLFRDAFDEVAVNNYLNRHNKTKIFISNNFGVHTMYNTIYADIDPGREDYYVEKEEEFFQFIKSEIDKRL